MNITRRSTLIGAGAAALTLGSWSARAAAKVAPFTIVINQSPWFDSFRKTVELYEKESGNEVELDVNPFGGSLEKQRNSVRARDGQYDLLMMNSGWFAEMYFGGFLEAISDIDPSYKIEPGLYTLADTIYFDPQKKTMDPSGKLMAMPINPNVPLLYYRGDLYKEAGLKAPDTFAGLLENSKRFHKPPAMYGMVQRGARGPHTVAYDFYPYLYGFGGSIFKDQHGGDYTVTLNDPKGKEALDYYIRLAREAGHPKTASMDQAEVLQAMVTGKAAHIMAVIAAWSQMDDPNKSIVVDKVEVAVPPHGPGGRSSPGLGHFVGGIARNVPDDRKRAAFEFLKWYGTGAAQIALAKNGGVPVHAAAYSDPMSQERRFRWMKPLSEALPNAVNIYNFPESADVIAVLELGLNRAIAGEISTKDALNGMATEIAKTMSARGYKSGTIDPL